MTDPKPAADPRTRYRTGRHVSRHIYDTWQSEPQADGPGDREVAVVLDLALAPVIVEALNDREQARANAAVDIHVASERRIEDLRAEFQRQRLAVERHTARLMDSTVGEGAPTGLSWVVWMAMDVIARDIVQRAVRRAVEGGDISHEDYPEIGVDDWRLISQRALALVEPHPDPTLSDAREAEKFLAQRTSNDPALPEVTR